MAKRNWFETISDNLPAECEYEGPTPFGKFFDSIFPTPVLEKHFTPIKDLMKGFESVGFQDKGDYYELVTDLGGNGDVKEDAVNIELRETESPALVKITYNHKASNEHSSYSHSQSTMVTLPEDANPETLSAYFDEERKNKVIVTVDKVIKKEPKSVRTIPINGKK